MAKGRIDIEPQLRTIYIFRKYNKQVLKELYREFVCRYRVHNVINIEINIEIHNV